MDAPLCDSVCPAGTGSNRRGRRAVPAELHRRYRAVRVGAESSVSRLARSGP